MNLGEKNLYWGFGAKSSIINWCIKFVDFLHEVGSAEKLKTGWGCLVKIVVLGSLAKKWALNEVLSSVANWRVCF